MALLNSPNQNWNYSNGIEFLQREGSNHSDKAKDCQKMISESNYPTLVKTEGTDNFDYTPSLLIRSSQLK